MPSLIGPWQPTRLLARSGPLAVCRARPAGEHLGPGCYVVKTVLDGDAAALGRSLLAREALAAGDVNHAGVVSVLSAHLGTARPYLVLPYLEGASLRQLLAAASARERRPLPPLGIGYALAIARQAAAALAALHAAGWLHGQVRPGHLRLSPQGHATLIDLSLARRLETDECDAGLSASGDAVYAAPEMFGHQRCTAASDTYSLGITLFEMLAGQPPFHAGNPRELARLHRTHTPPDIRSAIPQASLELNELVRRMLAKQPLRRPSDEELVRWLAEVEIAELER